jgi:uncharacterized protein YecE (DUF72 family)
LHEIKEADPGHMWKVAIEFRSQSWYNEGVYELLDFYSATVVIQDKLTGVIPPVNYKSDLVYVRFHGPAGNYRGSYSDEFLEEYATYVKEWIEDGKTVSVYFNNTMGEAFQNLVFLNKVLDVIRIL